MALKILVGSDPELFLRDRSSGNLISAHTIVPGTKLEPFKVQQGAVQVDGAAAEFNTDPADSHVKFVSNVKEVLNNLKNRANDKGLDLVLDPTVTFEPTYFSSLPEEVRELGCNPDFNAYTGQTNPPPDGESTTMRTASGHIHIGWCNGINPHDPAHFADCIEVVKQMDFYLGLYSLLWDPDATRRQLYGKAGAFRPKSYGVEYRTMSNVWLRSEAIQSWIFNSVVTGVNALSGKMGMSEKFGTYAKDCIDSNKTDWINTSEGTKIHNTMGMMVPKYKECLDFYKPKDTTAPVKGNAGVLEMMLKDNKMWGEFKTITTSTQSRKVKQPRIAIPDGWVVDGPQPDVAVNE